MTEVLDKILLQDGLILATLSMDEGCAYYDVLLCSRIAQIVIATSSYHEDTTFLSIETLWEILRCLRPLLAG